MTSSKLKYLYTAVYTDNTLYTQNERDISVTDASKSCYNDLRLDDIAIFTLSSGDTSYTLDLSDGGISVNGAPKFYLSTDTLTDFKLVYFRRVVMELTETTRSMSICYILGYTAKDSNNETVSNKIMIR